MKSEFLSDMLVGRDFSIGDFEKIVVDGLSVHSFKKIKNLMKA